MGSRSRSTRPSPAREDVVEVAEEAAATVEDSAVAVEVEVLKYFPNVFQYLSIHFIF